MIDARRLHIFREVARRGTISGAAQALWMTQPAVSRQIAALERETGTQLFSRAARGVTLTEAGRVVLDHADAIAGHLAAAEAKLDDLAELRTGRIRIGTFPTAGATVLLDALTAFHERHPGVELRVLEAPSSACLARLRAGELDLALSFDYPSVPQIEDRDLDRTLILTESMHVALPKTHPLAERQVVPLAELADDEWLTGSRPSTCGEVIFRACRNAGFEPRIGFESDDYHVMQGFIAAGLGLTLLPDLALPTLRDDLVVRATDPPAPQRRVWAATRAEGARSPATEEMVATLVEVGECFAARSRERLHLVA